MNALANYLALLVLQTIGIRGNLAQIVAEYTTPTSHPGTCITVLQRGFIQKVKVMPNFHGKDCSQVWGTSNSR